MEETLGERHWRKKQFYKSNISCLSEPVLVITKSFNLRPTNGLKLQSRCIISVLDSPDIANLAICLVSWHPADPTLLTYPVIFTSSLFIDVIQLYCALRSSLFNKLGPFGVFVSKINFRVSPLTSDFIFLSPLSFISNWASPTFLYCHHFRFFYIKSHQCLHNLV